MINTGEIEAMAEELELLRRERDLLKQRLAAVGRERDELAAHCERLMAAVHDALYLLENPHLPAHEQRVIEHLRKVLETKP